ncbi:MAG: tRNA dihydrouridine(20/20a) synthase DusA [Gammaproteobacteria bacterium]
MTEHLPRRFCVAPMLDWTDRHCRYFLRLLSRHSWLYTEMVTTGAILHGDWERLLGFDPAEQPVALQLGGSDPGKLARCAHLGAERGYAEINLNVGCPSDRVQSGRFGACLMATPMLVAEGVAAMAAAVDIPVTVKCRIGIDEQEDYATFAAFVDTVAAAGCRTFIIHARKAWLQGLSPKENRDIPPLRYDWVYRLKAERPGLEIILNGGIRSLDEAEAHLERVDGVMLGREVYHHPWLLAEVDGRLYGNDHPVDDPRDIAQAMLPYIEAQLARGTHLKHMTRHMLGLFQGQPGARAWRRHLSENAHHPGAGIRVVEDALEKMAAAAWTAREGGTEAQEGDASSPAAGVGRMDAAVKPTGMYSRRPAAGLEASTLADLQQATGE